MFMTFLSHTAPSFESPSSSPPPHGDRPLHAQNSIIHSLLKNSKKSRAYTKATSMAVYASPPKHSLAVVAAIAAVSVLMFPSRQSVDRVTSVQTFTTAILGNTFLASPLVLGSIRMAFAAFIFSYSYHIAAGDGHQFETIYLKQSKLTPTTIKYSGWKSLMPFTMWSWNLLGASFFLSGLIPILAWAGQSDLIESNPILMRAALLSFNVAAPAAMLVSAVVKYVLWPKAMPKKKSDPANFLARPEMIVTHNANAIMVLAEVFLLGGLPVPLGHMAVAPLYGCSYVLFAWYVMQDKWADGKGPQFLYYFLDTTLGSLTSYAILGLLAVMVTFYTIFSLLDGFIGNMDVGIAAHIVGMVALASLVCRFRD